MREEKLKGHELHKIFRLAENHPCIIGYSHGYKATRKTVFAKLVKRRRKEPTRNGEKGTEMVTMKGNATESHTKTRITTTTTTRTVILEVHCSTGRLRWARSREVKMDTPSGIKIANISHLSTFVKSEMLRRIGNVPEEAHGNMDTTVHMMKHLPMGMRTKNTIAAGRSTGVAETTDWTHQDMETGSRSVCFASMKLIQCWRARYNREEDVEVRERMEGAGGDMFCLGQRTGRVLVHY
ncbi:hypothetical protein V8B97DRAFT_1914516 [Scleroderma yunnanense]